jgi:hypothetical protein
VREKHRRLIGSTTTPTRSTAAVFVIPLYRTAQAASGRLFLWKNNMTDAPLYALGDDPAFERCLPDTLKEDGPDAANLRDPRNYSNDAHDKGGRTMDGIIQREYSPEHLRRCSGIIPNVLARVLPNALVRSFNVGVF